MKNLHWHQEASKEQTNYLKVFIWKVLLTIIVVCCFKFFISSRSLIFSSLSCWFSSFKISVSDIISCWWNGQNPKWSYKGQERVKQLLWTVFPALAHANTLPWNPDMYCVYLDRLQTALPWASVSPIAAVDNQCHHFFLDSLITNIVLSSITIEEERDGEREEGWSG